MEVERGPSETRMAGREGGGEERAEEGYDGKGNEK